MIEDKAVRNERVQKYCTYCGQPFLGCDDGQNFCEEHRSDE